MLSRSQFYKHFIAIVVLILSGFSLFANEGMWLLSMLKKYNADELRQMGLKIPVEMLTGENPESLSEAVVAFGSGCTGSFISDQGLVLTNYHCSYSAIQQHNNAIADITRNGFWANSNKEELPVSGLTVTVNRKVIDISQEVLKIVSAATANKTTVKDALAHVTGKYQKQYPQYKAITRSYKNNSLFVLYLQQQFQDVRLVGLGPKDITKFGGESDNWMWPRHSADFAYFRVYASKTGVPAAYHPSNIPLTVKTFLKISTAGYKEGDFAMSMGFPSNTDRNASAAKIWEKVEVTNPAMIAVQKQRLKLLEDSMASNSLARLAYAEEFAITSNEYKNAVGMIEWVDKLNIVAKKQQYEAALIDGWQNDKMQKAALDTAEAMIWASAQNSAPLTRAMYYFNEAFNHSCEVVAYVSAFGKGYVEFEKILKDRPSFFRDNLSNVSNYYKKFVPAIDRQMTKVMLYLLVDSLPKELLPDVFQTEKLSTRTAIDSYVDDMFDRSIFADSVKLKSWLNKPVANVADDPFVKFEESVSRKLSELRLQLNSNQAQSRRSSLLLRTAIEQQANNKFYPDADKTLRLSYGTVSDLQLDSKKLPYQTTLSTLVMKADTANKDYLLDPKLAEIWREKDFEGFGQQGDLPVCFITNGDVTGGNSGSPMLNGEGKLIGLVFDTNWESMTRDFNFEPSLHRVICADIRYILLLTEKCSESQRIVSEIKKANQASL